MLSDLGTFILNKRIADLLSYELSMPVRFDSNVRPFCFYHRDDFNALQEEEKKRIYGHHSNNLIVSSIKNVVSSPTQSSSSFYCLCLLQFGRASSWMNLTLRLSLFKVTWSSKAAHNYQFNSRQVFLHL